MEVAGFHGRDQLIEETGRLVDAPQVGALNGDVKAELPEAQSAMSGEPVVVLGAGTQERSQDRSWSEVGRIRVIATIAIGARRPGARLDAEPITA